MQYDYSYCVNRDRSKTNYPATKRRTKTIYCTLSDRYPHPDAASLCVWSSGAGWTIRWTGATSDNNFFLSFDKFVCTFATVPVKSSNQHGLWRISFLPPSQRGRERGRISVGSSLRSSIMRPLSSVLSISHVYLAYIMYRVSA